MSQRTVRFNNAIVPDATYARLTYRKGGTCTISSNPIYTNSGPAIAVYLNDPFDPDPSLGNASAQGFDYFRDYYGFYIVTRAKVKVDFYNLGTEQYSGYAAVGYVLPQLGSTINAITDQSPVNYIQNVPRLKWKRMTAPGGGKSWCTIHHEWSIKKDQAATNRGHYWEGSEWAAQTNAGPAGSYRRGLYIFAGTENGAGNVAAVTRRILYKVTVIYYTRFYGRKVTPELEDPE